MSWLLAAHYFKIIFVLLLSKTFWILITFYRFSGFLTILTLLYVIKCNRSLNKKDSEEDDMRGLLYNITRSQIVYNIDKKRLFHYKKDNI